MDSGIDKKTIVEVTTKLIGKIKPIGSVHIDSVRMKNLEAHIRLASFLIDELYFLIDSRNDYRSSVKDIGNKAYSHLKNTYDFLGEVLNEEK